MDEVNTHIPQELREKWPTYEFLGKPFNMRNGKRYMRAFHKVLEKTHFYEFDSDWFWHERPPGTEQ
jgi:hypothetical protein